MVAPINHQKASRRKRDDGRPQAARMLSWSGEVQNTAKKGNWLLATYLITSATVAPPLLSQPYAFAQLGWAGGVILNAVMAICSWYCMYHTALLFHHNGRRHETYKDLGEDILGGKAGRWSVGGLQYFINVGSVVTNIILSGQLLQDCYTILCTDPARCHLTGLPMWTAVGGGLLWLLCIVLPDMASLGLAGLVGIVVAAVYSFGAVGMAAGDTHAGRGASYIIEGHQLDRVMNGFNAIGILMFLYGITVVPEIQAVLFDHPKTGNTVRPMVYAATAAHAIFVPLYYLVGVVGYWAYGNEVQALLTMSTSRPVGLVVVCNVLGVLQVQVTSQLMITPMFESIEHGLIKRYPFQRWMRIKVGPMGPQPAQWPAAAAAAGGPKEGLPTSQAVHAGSALRGSQSRGPPLTTGGGTASSPDSVLVVSGDEDPLQTGQDRAAAAAGGATGGSGGGSIDAAAAAAAAVAAAPPPLKPGVASSWLLRFLVRSALSAAWTTFSVAMPFFSEIMGFIGAIGFGPFTFALPTILYLRAHGSVMPASIKVLNIFFVILWVGASLLAGIGSMYAIVQTATSFTFFSG